MSYEFRYCKTACRYKKEDKAKDRIQWGSLLQVPSIDNHIVQSAWKDNSIVLIISTTHPPINAQTPRYLLAIAKEGDRIGEVAIIRNRRRLKATSTSARTAHKLFGKSPTKGLPIPVYIDDYNHNTNHVDRVDQLRTNSQGLRPIRKGGWRAL
jgi:hypothetical protein